MLHPSLLETPLRKKLTVRRFVSCLVNFSPDFLAVQNFLKNHFKKTLFKFFSMQTLKRLHTSTREPGANGIKLFTAVSLPFRCSTLG